MCFSQFLFIHGPYNVALDAVFPLRIHLYSITFTQEQLSLWYNTY